MQRPGPIGCQYQWKRIRLVTAAALFVILELAMVPYVSACSLATSGVFTPLIQRWNQHAGPAQLNPGSSGEYWEGVPQPIVQIVEISRGKEGAGTSCADAGTILFAITLPESSTYSIDEFGVYFRVTRGDDSYGIFSDLPLVGNVVNGSAQILLAWLDGSETTHQIIDLEVEIFLVTHGLNIGPSNKIKIFQDK